MRPLEWMFPFSFFLPFFWWEGEGLVPYDKVVGERVVGGRGIENFWRVVAVIDWAVYRTVLQWSLGCTLLFEPIQDSVLLCCTVRVGVWHSTHYEPDDDEWEGGRGAGGQAGRLLSVPHRVLCRV